MNNIDCRGCKFCGMDMDMEFICYHPNTNNNGFGKYTRVARQDDKICGPDGSLFEPDPREFRKQFQTGE